MDGDSGVVGARRVSVAYVKPAAQPAGMACIRPKGTADVLSIWTYHRIPTATTAMRPPQIVATQRCRYRVAGHTTMMGITNTASRRVVNGTTITARKSRAGL